MTTTATSAPGSLRTLGAAPAEQPVRTSALEPALASQPAVWLEAAVERFDRPLVAYAWRLLGGGSSAMEPARDAVQDTFLRLVAARDDWPAIAGYLAAWLFTVCRNRCIDHLRSAGKESPMSHAFALADGVSASEPGGSGLAARRTEQTPIEAQAAAEDRSSTAHELRIVLARLPTAQQEVIRLKFEHGLSYAEIATVTGLSATNVGFQLHVGLKSLRERIAAHRRLAAVGLA